MPYDPAFPSLALRRLFVATEMQLSALRAAIAPHAERHGTQPAPGSVAADATRLLLDTRRLLAREPGWRGRLSAPTTPSWSALAIKLALAARGLAWFNQLYIDPADAADDDEDENERVASYY